MTIRAWLESIGLPQYAEAFEAEEVGPELVGELDHQTLRDLGVGTLGHRLKILQAAAATRSAPTDQGAWEAERRQLTIMFSDLVGSTALSTRLDPEDYRDLIRGYHEAVAALANEAGGHVAQFLGDGAMIYFGYPAALEDAAVRAVGMALALIEATRGFEPFPGQPVAIRIGIATGMVVVGDLVGRGLDEDAFASGETPNLAARLQTLAEPNGIIISDSTYQLLGRAFRTERLDPQRLKGFTGVQTFWRVLGDRDAEDRFEGRGAQRLSPLVGRAAEMQRLTDAWQSARAGQGYTVMLRGEPGLGKSRLLHEIASRADGARKVVLQCSPDFTNTSLYPIRRAIEQFAGFERADDAEVRLGKALRLLGLDPQSPAEDGALVAGLMGLPTDRFPVLTSSPGLQRRRLFEIVLAQIRRAAEEQPLLFFFEDLHWADPTSIEFLGLLIQAAPEFPALVVGTFRPEFAAPWTAGPKLSICDMHRLNADDMAQIVAHLAGQVSLPADLVKTLSDRADGVPLFLEELTKSVVMTQGSGSGYGAAAVPSSLLDTLMARLDRLNTARQIAQIASVIGRDFEEEVLAAIADRPLEEVLPALETLADAELVTRHEQPGVWAFHHALIRDAAYESLLRRSRQDLHRKIAEVTQRLYPERVVTAPEFVARHLGEAGEAGQAAPLWLAASRRARQRGAVMESLAHVNAGLDQAQDMTPSSARDALEMQFEMTRGYISFATAGYASGDAEAAFRRAGSLSGSVRDPDLLTAFHNGYGVYLTMSGDVHAGHRELSKLIDVVSGTPRLAIYAATTQTWSLFNRGDFSASLEWGRRLDAIIESGDWDPSAPRHTTGDPYVIGSCFHAATLWTLGFPDQAIDKAQATLDYARTLNDPFSVIYAQVNGVCRIADLCGRSEHVLEVVVEAVELAQRNGYEFAYGFARFWQARALAEVGDIRKGIEITTASLAACRAVSVRYHEPHFRAILAILQARDGDIDSAVQTLDGLEDLVDRSGERWQAADVRCARAEIAEITGHTDEAEAAWRAAFAAANAMHAPSWVLRAATGLAGVLAARDAADEARGVLAPLQNAFPEGSDTADLRRAADVLGRLAPNGHTKRSA